MIFGLGQNSLVSPVFPSENADPKLNGWGMDVLYNPFSPSRNSHPLIIQPEPRTSTPACVFVVLQWSFGPEQEFHFPPSFAQATPLYGLQTFFRKQKPYIERRWHDF